MSACKNIFPVIKKNQWNPPHSMKILKECQNLKFKEVQSDYKLNSL